MSKDVGSVKNQGAKLCAPVDLNKAKNFMANWLSSGRGTKRKTEDDKSSEQCQKRK